MLNVGGMKFGKLWNFKKISNLSTVDTTSLRTNIRTRDCSRGSLCSSQLKLDQKVEYTNLMTRALNFSRITREMVILNLYWQYYYHY